MRIVGALLLLAFAALGLGGCGGDGDDEAAKKLYGVYRSTEDVRNEAESRLRTAFSDLAQAAGERDREGVLDAAEDGREAAVEIEGLLAKEIEAAEGLGEFARLEGDADRLKRGLERTRVGLELFDQQLRLAARDPFLDEPANAAEVSRLARRAARLSVDGEFAIRRADRALALALGIEPRFDLMLDRETTTTDL
jgi:hypothetical protein